MILSWNVYGFGKSWSQKTLTNLVWAYSPSLCFSMLTKMIRSQTKSVQINNGLVDNEDEHDDNPILDDYTFGLVGKLLANK